MSGPPGYKVPSGKKSGLEDIYELGRRAGGVDTIGCPWVQPCTNACIFGEDIREQHRCLLIVNTDEIPPWYYARKTAYSIH